MNQVTAQSIQSEADRHHDYWQQAAEGIVIALHTDNKTQYASAGLTRDGGFKPDEKTLFEIGSITKVFTSILLAEAVRENMAEFDDAVSAHLPELKFKWNSPFRKMTLSELATHTSGLPRLPTDLFDGSEVENPYVHYDEQRLEKSLVSFKKKQLMERGEYLYSNYGAGILGYVLSQIYAQTYRDLLKEKILDPLNMESTDVPSRFAELPVEVRERLATPHVAGRAVSHWELASLTGAGAMISSAEDLIRFGTAHWDTNTPAGLAASLKEVAKPRLDKQGLGWVIEGDSLTHGGGTGGFRSNLTVDPGDKIVRVFLANSAGASDEMYAEGDFSILEGYWSGVLNAGTRKLRLIAFISEAGRVVVYSVDQGGRPVMAATTRLLADQFYFSFPSIEAVYEGKLENTQLKGKWVQGGGAGLPLNMEFSKEMPERLHQAVGESMQGDIKKLEGYWWGYLGGEKGLLVYLKVTRIGELSILQMYSPDQHNQAIAVSSASLKEDKVVFRSEQINGVFSGELASDQKSIEGVWDQGSSTPITLFFSEEKPARE